MIASSQLPKRNPASGPIERTATIHLTPREEQVLYYCALAKTSWEIGTILGCKASTVNYHIGNILRKFAVCSRVAAVIKALRYGLLKLQ
ncbi:response regulator transcription factor [Pseudomonas fontis]|uniref:Helix-turn-helix domain-containing protein n=1 Tax=Pseudomonas fontis TaxID=2942633 RepID=A0ABT5NMV0_9PSED|nr:LuxR family transcriptional regulator [Pseudomonas fontis]MDD0975809.1 helix-turn-helix domain-containing protein [Pseudomonas fontis]MDD0989483.1 helix-turn-helix domain-containing protein [Pseudomonas fontis]